MIAARGALVRLAAALTVACGAHDGADAAERAGGSGGAVTGNAGGHGGSAAGIGSGASSAQSGSSQGGGSMGGVGAGGSGASQGDVGGGSGEGSAGADACPAQPLAAGDYGYPLSHGGIERVFDLHVPAGHDPAQPTPLVFYLHPLLMDKNYLKAAGTIAKSDAEGFLAVFPDGVESSWNGGVCCAPANGVGDNPIIDDVGFIRAVLDAVEKLACVDRKRIYATGFSNGGFLSYRLACDAADVFAAVAPVSAVLGLDSEHCNPSRPVPVFAINGTADNLVPYQGGFSFPGVTDGAFMSVPQSFAIWADENGCNGAPQVAFVNGSASCQTHNQCAAGAEVTLCTLQGAGHCWFGEPFCALGTNSNDLRATDATWEFLKRFSLP